MQPEKSIKETFPVRLRTLVADSGLTQQQLAAATGVSQASISGYLNGRRLPGPGELLVLARHFGVSLEYLLGAENLNQAKEPAPSSTNRQAGTTPGRELSAEECERLLATAVRLRGDADLLEGLASDNPRRSRRRTGKREP